MPAASLMTLNAKNSLGEGVAVLGDSSKTCLEQKRVTGKRGGVENIEDRKHQLK